MEVKNCNSCGKLYNHVGGPPLCAKCAHLLEDKFDKVKEYIYDNPGVGMQIVSDEMEVSVAQIKKWIREERLTFSEDSAIGLECEYCGTLIRTGRFCNHCKDKMINSLDNIYSKPKVEGFKKETKDSPKMRFLNK